MKKKNQSIDEMCDLLSAFTTASNDVLIIDDNKDTELMDEDIDMDMNGKCNNANNVKNGNNNHNKKHNNRNKKGRNHNNKRRNKKVINFDITISFDNFRFDNIFERHLRILKLKDERPKDPEMLKQRNTKKNNNNYKSPKRGKKRKRNKNNNHSNKHKNTPNKSEPSSNVVSSMNLD